MTAPALFCPRCATPNAFTATVCQNPTCGSALPRMPAPAPVASPAASGGQSLAAIETHLIIERSRVKSPLGAAALGFILPWAGALYNGKMMMAGVLFGVHILVAVVGLPFGEVPLMAIYGIAGAIINYNWAKQTNEKALEKLVAQRR